MGGLLTKTQKTGPHGLKQLGIYTLGWAACPVKFPEWNLFNGVNFARQTDQTNQTDQTGAPKSL